MWQKRLYQWELAAANNAMAVFWQHVTWLDSAAPNHLVFLNGALTLGAWAMAIANSCRTKKYSWQFTLTHTDPAVVSNAQRWTQWYPEITVVETASAEYDPLLWADSDLLLTYTVDDQNPEQCLIAHWHTPLWLQWQWRQLPPTLKTPFYETLSGGLPLGKGLYK